MKKLFNEELQEDYSSEDVKAFLDEVGGYTDYDGKVEELMDYFGMTKDQAESAIQDYVTSSDDDDEDEDDDYIEKLWDALYDVSGIQEIDHSANEAPDHYIIVFESRGDVDKRENEVTSALTAAGFNATCTAVNGSNVFEYHIPMELDEAVSDLSHAEREFDSAATSINSSKLPAIYKMVNFNEGDVVIDFGGGRFDNAVEYIKDKGATLVVYDPYNRSAEHNEQVLATLEENGGADAAVNSNVLNVIKEPEAR